MAILVTLHAVQAIQPHPLGDYILCRRDGALLAPRRSAHDGPDATPVLHFTAADQQHNVRRTLLVGEHGTGCAVTLSALAGHGEEVVLGCVEIAIEQSSIGFSECIDSTETTLYAGREGRDHLVDMRCGERRFRLRFRAQLVTDL